MKDHSQIPIVQVSYQLSIDLRRSVARFPKVHRQSLGDYLAIGSGQFLEKVLDTNCLQDHSVRRKNLQSLMGALMNMRLHVRMARDLRCISNGLHAELSRKLDDIQRQLSGWYKWVNSELEKQNRKC